MDARAVAETAGIDVGRLNMWVQQKQIPGMAVGARGRQRDFSLEVATHIMIMAEIARFGIGATMASAITDHALQRRAGMVILTQPVTQPDPTRPGFATTNMRTAFLKNEAEVPRELGRLRKKAAEEDQPAPTIFVLVDVKTLSARMRAAHEEWEQQETQNPKADH